MKICYKVTIKDTHSGKEVIFYLQSTSPKPRLLAHEVLKAIDKVKTDYNLYNTLHQLAMEQHVTSINDTSTSSSLVSVRNGQLLASNHPAVVCLMLPHIELFIKRSDGQAQAEVEVLFSNAASVDGSNKTDTAVTSGESNSVKTKHVELMKFVMWALELGDSGTGLDAMFSEFVNGLNQSTVPVECSSTSCDIPSARVDRVD
ncbi:hypothetical protein HDU76_005579 [Blyttiomyces sp. JEL0837]|nr:hypothetical protein HDU76_005579 [Blyttiomyces sp. JEL0837]